MTDSRPAVDRHPKRRRSPSVPFFFPDWLELHEVARNVKSGLEQYGRGRLLDVGCGEKPFQVYATPAIAQWVGLDAPGNPHAEIQAFADSIPEPDESYDTVLCTQVLEHVQEPQQALREIYRVLRPGGHVIITVPQYWPIHEAPYDFFRYTPHGLRHLLETSGLQVVEQRIGGSGFRVAAQAANLTISACGERLPGGKSKWGRALFVPFYLLNNAAAVILDRFLPDRQNILNNCFIARKPGRV